MLITYFLISDLAKKPFYKKGILRKILLFFIGLIVIQSVYALIMLITNFFGLF